MRAVVSAAVVFCLGFGAVGSARADSILRVSPFSGSVVDLIGMTPFDTTLGTLDAIQVNITGSLVVSGATSLNMIPVSPGGFAPVPYNFQATVVQDFEGLAGRYFDLEDYATFTLSGLATGAGEGFSLSTLFTYDFAFNSLTDLMGFAIPSVQSTNGPVIPPFAVSATRSDFFAGIPIDEVDMFQTLTIVPFAAVTPFVASVTSGGLIQVTYDYTPAPVAVPEPAALAIIGIAAAMWLTRRRRFAVR